MTEKLRFDVSFGRAPRQPSFARGDEDIMRILLLADFSGRSLPGAAPAGERLTERSPRRVDIDNFEDILRGWAPRLSLPAADGTDARIAIEFRDLEAFHPDSLYQRLPTFEGLRSLRRRLLDPATSAEAVAELKRGTQAPAPAAATPASTGTAAEEGDSGLFERLLGGASTATSAKTAAQSTITELIRRVVEPHIVPAADPQATQLVAAVDDAISEHMRRILHDPGFQALESAWRGAHWLVTGLETNEALQLYLLDVGKSELAADIAGAGGSLEESALYRLLMQHGPGVPDGPEWSVLAGQYRFGAGPEDVQLLAALGAIGAQVGGPFLAEADAAILGCQSLVQTPDDRRWDRVDDASAERWRALRQSRAARWLGLALPRVLLRVPYGRDSESVDQFGFEEMPTSPRHDAYLWGSPAFACALLLGQAYTDAGSAMAPGDRQELLDLPCHSYVAAGARALTPCGEVLLSERTADAILARGLMPTLSFKDRNAVRIGRFQSLADPPAPLAGPWAA